MVSRSSAGAGSPGFGGERVVQPPAPSGVGGDLHGGHRDRRISDGSRREDHRSRRLVRCVPSPARSGGQPHGRRPPPQLGGHRRIPTRSGAGHAASGGVLRGGFRQVADRRGVVVERGHAVQLPPGQARRAREGRRAAGRRRPDRVHDHRGLRRHRDGPRGHEGVADQPRGDRRLGGAGDARRAVRRAGRHRRLRQERAGDADGDGAPEPAVGLPVRRHDPARAPTRAATSRSRTCSRPWGRTPRGRSTTTSCCGSSAPPVPTTGSCAGMYTANTMAAAAEALGMSLPGAASPPAVDYRREVFARESGRRSPGCSRRRSAAARHPHQGGVRERDRRGDGAGRIDERRPAPARDRARGARAARARRLRRDLAPGAAPGRRPAGGTVRDAGPRSRRRRARRDEGTARRGPAARRRDHGHRQDDRAEPRGAGAGGAGRRRWSGRSPSRSIPTGGTAILRGSHRPRRLGHEDRGRGGDGLHRHRAAVRLGARRVRRAHGRHDRGRRRHRDPIRGPEGLARHAARCSRSRRPSPAPAWARTSR